MTALRIPQRFIYLDSLGLDSLHAQITSLVPGVPKRGEQTGNASARSRRERVASALRSFLGLRGVNIVGPPSPAEELEGRERTSPEARYFELIKHLVQFEHELYFVDLAEATARCESTGEAVFVNVGASFDAPDFYEPAKGLDIATRSGAVFFKVPWPRQSKGRDVDVDAYENSDDYFRRSKTSHKIVMSAGLDKFTGGRVGSVTSHIALLLRGSRGRNLKLRVFGYLSPLGADLYQIKPYA